MYNLYASIPQEYWRWFNTVRQAQQLLASARVLAIEDEQVPTLSTHEKLDPQMSTIITLSTGTPQGFVCVPAFATTTSIMFSHDATVIRLISSSDESDYRVKVKNLVCWCSENNLPLTTAKTKELIFNFGRSQDHEYASLFWPYISQRTLYGHTTEFMASHK